MNVDNSRQDAPNPQNNVPPHPPPSPMLLPPPTERSGPRWLREGYARNLFETERHPSRYTLSQKALPLLFVAISAVPVGGAGGRAGLHRASY